MKGEELTQDHKPHFEWEDEAPKGSDKYLKRRVKNKIPKNLQSQFLKGTILAKITSRPGQSGRCDGSLLEGAELDFYLKKVTKKR